MHDPLVVTLDRLLYFINRTFVIIWTHDIHVLPPSPRIPLDLSRLAILGSLYLNALLDASAPFCFVCWDNTNTIAVISVCRVWTARAGLPGFVGRMDSTLE